MLRDFDASLLQLAKTAIYFGKKSAKFNVVIALDGALDAAADFGAERLEINRLGQTRMIPFARRYAWV